MRWNLSIKDKDQNKGKNKNIKALLI